MNKRFAVHCLTLSLTLFAGCSVGPDYRRPEFDLPQDWHAVADAAPARPADSVGERWWTLYGDPVLDRLIEEALQHNTDVAVAAARVLEARALASIADSALYPSVYGQFSGNRTKSSALGPFPIEGFPLTQNDYRATLNASYEIDFWGKYRHASEAARADLLAAEAGSETVRLSLTAQVAQQYFALLAADAQIAVTERTLRTRTETLTLFEKRVQFGTLSEYDLHQAQAAEAATRSQLAALRRTQDSLVSALALQLGRSPRAVMEDDVERGSPAAVTDVVIPAGLPSDLLLRRPDLRQAEEQLIAANAHIGAARADYFPAVGLTAYLGSESVAFSQLFTGPAGIFQFAAAITQPLWNAGRLRAGTQASEARRDRALADYQRAVASAFKDTRDALAAQNAAREVLAAESVRVTALTQALGQARLRFDAGITSQLDVLDVERNLLVAELVRIDAERARKAALADLFKALGGGWAEPAVAPAPQ